MSSSIVVFMLFAVAVSLSGVYAQNKCYQCDSGNNEKCDDPFDTKTARTVNCSSQFCSKVISIVSGVTTVSRNCSEGVNAERSCERPSSSSQNISATCICSGNLCNTASRDTFGSTVLMAITGAAVIAVLCTSYLK